ncbi:hypothetical protein CBR_g16000 [Chara braunii]|uniref:Serine-threonine/tyrosine-protein kinase catalytic domain-containing protein n=1 Tax=Chara braunii TaxID=69332 RepID=A0A388JST2_CHABU|nr:hypothetical protein CBR_g16000 [Chara braunii]|eukprot:GBG60879.1 hypothetical protein CBR_g16000 [Chara braunii]
MVGKAVDSGQMAVRGKVSAAEDHSVAAASLRETFCDAEKGGEFDEECGAKGGRAASLEHQQGGRESGLEFGVMKVRGGEEDCRSMGNGAGLAMGSTTATALESPVGRGGGGGGEGRGCAVASEREKYSPGELQRMAFMPPERFSVGLRCPSGCSAERDRVKMERFSGPDRPCAASDREAERIKHQKFSGPDKLGGGGGPAERPLRSPCAASSRSPSVGSNYSSSSLLSGSEALQRSPWQQENMKHCLIDPKQLVIGEKFASGPKAAMHRGVFCKLEMAIKMIATPETPEEVDKLEQAFTEEVTMSLRLRHRNVIQEGSCVSTRLPLWKPYSIGPVAESRPFYCSRAKCWLDDIVMVLRLLRICSSSSSASAPPPPLPPLLLLLLLLLLICSFSSSSSRLWSQLEAGCRLHDAHRRPSLLCSFSSSSSSDAVFMMHIVVLLSSAPSPPRPPPLAAAAASRRRYGLQSFASSRRSPAAQDQGNVAKNASSVLCIRRWMATIDT